MNRSFPSTYLIDPKMNSDGLSYLTPLSLYCFNTCVHYFKVAIVDCLGSGLHFTIEFKL